MQVSEWIRAFACHEDASESAVEGSLTRIDAKRDTGVISYSSKRFLKKKISNLPTIENSWALYNF